MKNVIVSVSLTGIDVELGYVTVDGFWRQPVMIGAHWRLLPALQVVAWKTRAAPVTVWREKN